MKKTSIILSVLSLVCHFTFGIAQDKSSKEATQVPSGFRGEFLQQLYDVQKKIIDLADAMPQETYAWRPMEGVRSVSEVFNHIAGSNFYLPTMAGIKAPEGYNSDEGKKITERAKVVENLKESFAHLRQAVMSTADADMEKSAKWFGQPTTVRGVFCEMANHLHEHLGQSIAYARMNKVVPPWTAAEQAQQQKKDSKK